jgi:enoyl-CoA hydratase
MNDAEILFERRGVAGVITLNRPKALNSLTHGMCLAMTAQLGAWKDDPAIACVVVRGTGDRAFCAGGDIRSLYESGKAGTPYALDFWRDEYILDATIKHFPKPYIALLHGIVMGGGVGVSVHGCHRVADESVVFAMPETGIGLFPDVGGSFFLPRCPGHLGMYLALTGARLMTADCIYAGVATHFVPAGETEALADKLSAGERPEDAVAAVAQVPGESLLCTHRQAIDRLFAGGSVEAIVAQLDADGEDWARAIAAAIRAKSPTSLKLAYRQLGDGARQDFDACMRMEYRMVNRIIAGHDFYEGVRAAIIDKDQSPKWKPAALEDVSDSDVDAYFAPLGEKELKL